MSRWTAQRLYDAKPWVFCVLGMALAIGMTVWSLVAGSWTAWRSLACFSGAGLTVVGAVTLQLRQEYRARSKWRREGRR